MIISPKAGRAKNALISIFQILYAIFIAASLTFERKLEYSGTLEVLYPSNFMSSFEWIDLVIFVVILLVSFVLLETIKRFITWRQDKSIEASIYDKNDSIVEDVESKPFLQFVLNNKKIVAFIFLTIMVGWIIVFLNYYPGTSMNDQLTILNSPISYGNNHPLIYNLMLAGCVDVGHALFSSNAAGLALFVVLQMLICASLLTFSIIWLSYRKTPKFVLVLVLLFFAFAPVISNYSINTIKDTLFSYILLMWLPFLYEASSSPDTFFKKKSTFVFLGLLIFFTIIMRNNGLYIALALALVIILVYRKHTVLKIIGVVLLSTALASVPNLYLNSIGTKQLFRESVGIPIQQMAAVVCNNPESMTFSQQDLLYAMLPASEYEKLYNPMFVDSIKYSPEFDTMYIQDHKRLFVKTYLELGAKYPSLYTQAWLSQTYSNWSLLAENTPFQSYFFELSGNGVNQDVLNLLDEMDLENNSVYPDNFANWFDKAYRSIVWAPGGGFLFAALLMCVYLVVITKRQSALLIIALPAILLWGTLMIATPLSGALRYAFPFLVMLPFVLALISTKHRPGV